MNELAVPKRRVEVEIAFEGGEWRRVGIFVGALAADHPGPERVSDVLRGAPAFFPAHDLASGDTICVARAAIVAVRLPPGSEPFEDPAIPTEAAVEVVLRGGARVAGVLTYVRPPGRSRVVDFLNDAPAFFPLWTSPDELLLLNREHVLRVVLARG